MHYQYLGSSGLHGLGIRWRSSRYLTDRKQRVTACAWSHFYHPSCYFKRSSGFHGWSCSLYPVNDLPDAVKFNQFAMFADDTKLFSTIRTENDCKDLQNILDNLQVWSSVQSHITWNKQVDYQSTKSNKLLGFIRRLTLYIHNTAVRRILYLALVRSRLGYTTQICSP